ncbi:MAG: tetratricopeptide repeat protein, partial [Promethearchaeota archaeon]
MGQETINKYEFLVEFLIDLFDLSLDEIITDNHSQIKILNTDLKKLSEDLKYRWNNLVENLYDYPSIQNEYIEKLAPWKEKFDAFHQVKSRKDFIKFLEKYYSTWIRLSFEEKDISRKEIFQMLKNERPKITSSINTTYWGYHSLSLFKNDLFELTAHLKLRSYGTGTYSLVIIFSLWFENIKDEWTANLNSINKDYKNSLIAYEIVNLLKTLNYVESSLIFKPPERGNKFWKISTSTSESSLHPSNNLILEILSDTPVILFKEFQTHLNKIEEKIQSYTKMQDLTPYSYFENLSSELQQFLIKGKELFLKAQDLLKSPRHTDGSEKEGEIKDLEMTKISFSQIIAFFKDALEQDKSDDTILYEDKGFRTQHQIYEEYRDKIDGSLPTFYKYFDNLRIETYLEVRDKSGKGGGTEYRYKEITTSTEQKSEELLEIKVLGDKINLTSERLGIQEGLSYYNNHDYNTSTKIFKNVLNSEELSLDTNLYCSCLYYLGRSHFKTGNYQEALEYLKKAYMENHSLYNVKYSLIETYLQLYDYQNALKQADELILGLKEIFQRNSVIFNLDYLFRQDFEPGDFKYLHPKLTDLDMFSDHLILINKSSISITPFPPTEIYITQGTYNTVNRNIISLQILYKKYLRSVFLKLEILRRQYFIEMFGTNEVKIHTIIDNFIQHINFLKEDPFLSYLSIEDYEIYISYFIGLSRLVKNRQITEKLSFEFPTI